MEEIIGILVFVVLAIIKIIDKKFSSASGKSAPMEETHEVFPEIEVEAPERPVYRHEQMQPVQKAAEHFAGQPVADPVQKTSAKPAARPAVKNGARSILKEEPQKTREKIDPKKLIVYSEIMNRKY